MKQHQQSHIDCFLFAPLAVRLSLPVDGRFETYGQFRNFKNIEMFR